MHNKVELLAPAGSYDCLRAAVNAGANAVYIGGSRFGARAFADNPIEDELIKGIEFCHLRGRKIYLTVNTLFKEYELEHELDAFLRPYYQAGVDAVIVQDTGAMSYISDHFPGLPIHVSTQASITAAEGLEMLKRSAPAIDRIVPARELSIDEIRAFRAGTDVEIEVFIHGALCYSCSGQCLMSSLIGGRSGNRGRCAQPCRKLYDGKYLLSLKDNCLLEYLPELIGAGVNSLKIEGRMKSPEYTAGVVSLYRKYLDMYYSLGAEEYDIYISKHKQELSDDTEVLRELYNRGGFIGGYLHRHNGPDMMCFDRPNHSGIEVGEVNFVRGREAVIGFTADVSSGDVIEIRDGQNKVFEFTLGKELQAGESFSAITMKGRNAARGQKVFRTKNASLLKSIDERYIDKNSKVRASMSFRAHLGEQISLSLSGGGETVTVFSEPPTKAVNAPIDKGRVIERLLKMGETEFETDESAIAVELDDGIFFVMGELNRLRRDAAAQLREMIIEAVRRKSLQQQKDNGSSKAERQECSKADLTDICQASEEQKPAPFEIGVSVWTAEQFRAAAAESRVSDIYCNISSADFEHAASGSLEECLVKRFLDGTEDGKNIYIALPYISRKPVLEKLERLIAYLAGRNTDCSFLARTWEETELLERMGCSYRTDYNIYAMNSRAVSFIGREFTLPAELNSTELKSVCSPKAELIVYGYQPVMFSAQCVYKNKYGRCRDNSLCDFIAITDELGHDFRCRQLCSFCTNIIYNSAKLCLLEKWDEITALAPGRIRLDFTFENGNEVKEVLRQTAADSQFTDPCGQHLTNGHFTRGVQ